VEKMNKKVAGLLAVASDLIYSARWEIDVPYQLGQAHYLPGQVIRSADGDLFIKLDAVKQKVGHRAQEFFMDRGLALKSKLKTKWARWKEKRAAAKASAKALERDLD